MQLDRSWSRPGAFGDSVRPVPVALVLLGFAAALAVFLLVPPFLQGQVGSVVGFTGQEAADVLTPLIAMPLLVLAVELTGRLRTRDRVLLAAFVAMWVAGQGIHLAANAIGDVLPEGAPREAFYATAPGALDHWLDEVLSHWLWHVGWVGLLGVLLVVGSRMGGGARQAGRTGAVIAAVAGALHGFTWFVVTDEGETWPLAIPATTVLLLLAVVLRARGGERAITTFVIVGSLVTLALYAAWIVLAGWPPQSIIEALAR